MNLVVDIGNSLTKVAIIEGESIINVDKYEILSTDVIDKTVSKYAPSRAIISNVGKIDKEISSHLKNIIPTIEFTSLTKIPITINYKTPQTLGLDRIALAVGANYLYPSTNLLVIGCGTAITYDLVDSKSMYYGGAISPGIVLRFKSLNQHTANLPLLEQVDKFELIGSSTSECIESGVLNGVIGEVDYFIDSFKTKFPSLKVLVTGGDANFFVNKLKNSIFVVQNLVIIGLNRIIEFNAKH
ncbi:MAG: type III pantothenate kinase [Bacteroidales bacterium]|nr:type III pantothenate kinase [Bacteroidales bacterium]